MIRQNRLFLCYATEDIDRVRAIHLQMSQMSIPMWFDKVDLVTGQPLDEAIRNAIHTSRFFAIFLSRFAARKLGPSPGFQKKELDYAYQIARGEPLSEFTILPLRFEDCDDSGLEVLTRFDLFPRSELLNTLRHIKLLIVGNSMSPATRSPDIGSLIASVVAFIKANDQRRALKILDNIARIKPNNFEALHLRGCILEANGQLKDAIQYYSLAIESHPGFALAYSNRGLAYYKLGDNAEALAEYDRSIELNPNRPTPYNNRGVLKRKQGDLSGALVDFNRAVSLAPSYTGAYANRANVHLLMNNIEEGECDIARALDLDPHNVQAHFTRGQLRHAKGDYSGAIDDFTQITVLNPRFREAYFHRAMVLEDSNDLEGAITDYARSIEIEPTANAYFNRALVLRKLGRDFEAIADFGKTLDQDPKDKEARRCLLDTLDLNENLKLLLANNPGLLRKFIHDPAKVIEACRLALREDN